MMAAKSTELNKGDAEDGWKGACSEERRWSSRVAAWAAP